MAKENLVLKDNLVDVFMPMEKAEAHKRGYKVVYRRIGIKTVSGIITKGTKEFAEKYELMLDTENRAELREKRCLVEDGKGGFIRCPECNSCNKCKKKKSEKFSTNSPLSFERLTKAESEDDKVIDIPDKDHDVESDAIAFMSTSYVSYTKSIFEVIKMPEILEKSSFFACIELKFVI